MRAQSSPSTQSIIDAPAGRTSKTRRSVQRIARYASVGFRSPAAAGRLVRDAGVAPARRWPALVGFVKRKTSPKRTVSGVASYCSGSPYALNFRSLSWSASLASRSVAPVAAISPSSVFAIAVQVPSEASSKVIHVSPLSFAPPLFLLTSVIWTAYGDHPASALEYPDPAEGLHGNRAQRLPAEWIRELIGRLPIP
jgi:hypothetical protein